MRKILIQNVYSRLFAFAQNLISLYDKAVILTTYKVSGVFVKNDTSLSVAGVKQTFHLDNSEAAAAAALLLVLCCHRNSVRHALVNFTVFIYLHFIVLKTKKMLWMLVRNCETDKFLLTFFFVAIIQWIMCNVGPNLFRLPLIRPPVTVVREDL